MMIYALIMLMVFIVISSPIGAINNNETIDNAKDNISNITAITYRSLVDQDY